ncbi:pyridoxamine kinase [Enterocloster asparagiformis]|uniref:pyridoxamine kinase n=1 Tax=Enterocloster asparagiformis TaxID=333367 RepID=UPI0004646923|nr:pyridoxamine kinase [Enterocloster asparagiformis]
MSQFHQKKVAMINDLSGYGRCSLTVAVPILSAMKVQCCPVPTSILSNHTGFPVYFFDDYTAKLPAYLEKWGELGLEFDGIVSGFLGSVEQIRIVEDMIGRFKGPETKVVVDPIMGDNGKKYATYTEPMCEGMRRLVGLGDVVTPNLTEACILTDRPYRREGWTVRELEALAGDIRSLGARSVVITGISQGVYLANYVAEQGRDPVICRTKRVGRERPGTGDVFASVVSAAYVRGFPLERAVRLASSFVRDCIRKSEELEIPVQNGVCFEELMDRLTRIR